MKNLVIVRCPDCRRKRRIPEDWVGKPTFTGRCKKCHLYWMVRMNRQRSMDNAIKKSSE